jgi:hypothetical protein
MSHLQQLPLELYSKIASYLNDRDVQNLIWVTQRLPLRNEIIARPVVFMMNEIDYSRIHLYTIVRIQFQITFLTRYNKYFIRNTCCDFRCRQKRAMCYNDNHKGILTDVCLDEAKKDEKRRRRCCTKKGCKLCCLNTIYYNHYDILKKTRRKIKFNIIKMIQTGEKKYHNEYILFRAIVRYLNKIDVSDCKSEYVYLLNEADWINYVK